MTAVFGYSLDGKLAGCFSSWLPSLAPESFPHTQLLFQRETPLGGWKTWLWEKEVMLISYPQRHPRAYKYLQFRRGKKGLILDQFKVRLSILQVSVQALPSHPSFPLPSTLLCQRNSVAAWGAESGSMCPHGSLGPVLTTWAAAAAHPRLYVWGSKWPPKYWGHNSSV